MEGPGPEVVADLPEVEAPEVPVRPGQLDPSLDHETRLAHPLQDAELVQYLGRVGQQRLANVKPRVLLPLQDEYGVPASGECHRVGASARASADDNRVVLAAASLSHRTHSSHARAWAVDEIPLFH